MISVVLIPLLWGWFVVVAADSSLQDWKYNAFLWVVSPHQENSVEFMLCNSREQEIMVDWTLFCSFPLIFLVVVNKINLLYASKSNEVVVFFKNKTKKIPTKNLHSSCPKKHICELAILRVRDIQCFLVLQILNGFRIQMLAFLHFLVCFKADKQTKPKNQKVHCHVRCFSMTLQKVLGFFFPLVCWT